MLAIFPGTIAERWARGVTRRSIRMGARPATATSSAVVPGKETTPVVVVVVASRLKSRITTIAIRVRRGSGAGIIPVASAKEQWLNTKKWRKSERVVHTCV